MNATASSLAMPSSYEEEFMGFEIYIETNPDKWREGFVWLVSKDGEEIDSGLVFEFDDAILVAKQNIQLALNI